MPSPDESEEIAEWLLEAIHSLPDEDQEEALLLVINVLTNMMTTEQIADFRRDIMLLPYNISQSDEARQVLDMLRGKLDLRKMGPLPEV